ncbi:hypothetical protein [Streptomyces daliensis]
MTTLQTPDPAAHPGPDDPEPDPERDPGTGPDRSPHPRPHPRAAPGTGRARAWAVGWLPGAAQSLGLALLLVTELVRADVGEFGRGVLAGELPRYAHGFRASMEAMSGDGWYRAAEAVRDALALGEPRAMLWAAVCAALVVRLNRYGPPRVQCVLSLAAALYCVPAAVTGIPYFALAGAYALPFVLLLGVVVMTVATRRPPRHADG